MFTNLFIAGLIVTAFVGFDVAHTPKEVVKAQEVVATPTPTATPKPVCSTVTPYDSEIEQVWGVEACNAKRVLRWLDVNGNVYGENGGFKPVVDVTQHDGSVDRGLFRINSNIFYDYMRAYPQLLHNNSIFKWDDMNDPVLNIRLAHIIWMYGTYCRWYAAPPSLCSNNYPNVQEAK